MKSLPTNEILWFTYHQDDERSCIITSNKDRSMYFAYGRVDEDYKRLGKDRSAGVLAQKYIREGGGLNAT